MCPLCDKFATFAGAKDNQRRCNMTMMIDAKTIKQALLKGERVTLECKTAQSNVRGKKRRVRKIVINETITI